MKATAVDYYIAQLEREADHLRARNAALLEALKRIAQIPQIWEEVLYLARAAIAAEKE